MSTWSSCGSYRHALRQSALGLSLGAGFLIALTLPLTDACYAAEWLVEGHGEVTTEYDDNILLQPDNEISALGITVSPEFSVGGRKEIWDVFLTTRLDLARFTDDDTLDSEDVTASFNGNYRTQLTQWSLTGTLKRLNTRTSEITDSGIVNARATRTEYELLPSGSFRVSPRNDLRIFGQWNQAFFDKPSLDDFTAYSTGGDWRHKLTQRDDITLKAFFSHLENDDVLGNEADILGVQLAWHRMISERIETRIAVGPRYADTQIRTPKDTLVSTGSGSSFGLLINGMIAYDIGERTKVSGNLSRSVEPSGLGAAVERDRIDITVRHDIGPRLRLSVVGRYLESRDPNNEGAVRERRYFSVRPIVRWEIERDWFVSGSYRFRAQKFEEQNRAYSNAVFLSLTHRFQPWHFGD